MESLSNTLLLEFTWTQVAVGAILIASAALVTLLVSKKKRNPTVAPNPEMAAIPINLPVAEEIIRSPRTLEEIERERDAMEMKLAFAKGELIKVVKEYPSFVCRAAEDFFQQGNIVDTTLYLEALGWENARKLFKYLDTRMWSRVGASLREREKEPSTQDIFEAVHRFHRYAFSFVLERAGREAENPFSFLLSIEDSQRIDLLSQEDPATIALISVFCSGAQMCELLVGLDSKKQNQVLLEITRIKTLPEAAVKEGVDSLLMRLERIKADPFIHADGPLIAADFMRSLDPLREEELYQFLIRNHPIEAEKIRHVRVMFADILHYPKDMVRAVVDSVDPEDLLRALIGCPQEFVKSILSLLPTKKAALIQNDLVHMSERPAHSICAEFRRKIISRLELEFESRRFSTQDYWRGVESLRVASPAATRGPQVA